MNSKTFRSIVSIGVLQLSLLAIKPVTCYRPPVAWKGFRSPSSRRQLCSASIRWPAVASLGILERQALSESSIAPAAMDGIEAFALGVVGGV